MIDQLIIENFRGINHIEVNDLRRINIFVGENNSGKTSVLEAIFLNIGAVNPELAPRINAFRDHNKVDDSFFRSFFYNFDINNPIKIHTVLKNPKQYRELSITPNYSKRLKEKIVNITDIEAHENTSLNTQEIIGLDNVLAFKESSKGNFKSYKYHLKKNQKPEIFKRRLLLVKGKENFKNFIKTLSS